MRLSWEKKKLLMVPCICAIVGDCDAAFSTFSGMGFINNHNACHWSWGNIYRFPWILCPSCIHLNTSRRRQKCILFHLSGCPLLNTSLTLWNDIMCALYPTVMFSLITTLPMGFELQHYFLTWVMWKWQTTFKRRDFTCQSQFAPSQGVSVDPEVLSKWLRCQHVSACSWILLAKYLKACDRMLPFQDTLVVRCNELCWEVVWKINTRHYKLNCLKNKKNLLR